MARRLPIFLMVLVLAAVLVLGLKMWLSKPEAPSVSERVAEVVVAQGEVLRRPFLYSQWVKLKVGDLVFERDEVKTGDDGLLRLKFAADGQELEFSPKSRVEIKRRSLKVNGGSVENKSEGGNPFAISVGGMTVVFKSREGALLESAGEEGLSALVNNKWLELEALLAGDDKISWEAKLEESKKGDDVQAMAKLWEAMDIELEALQKNRQDVKIIVDEETGAVRTQVSEGTVSLQLDGQAGTVNVSEGEGLIMSKDSSDVLRVKLLPAPKNISPEGGRLYNVERLELSWSPYASAKKYRGQVSSEQDFSANVIDFEGLEPNASVEMPSSEGWVHWRVWAVDEHGFDGLKATASLELLIDTTPPELKVNFIQ
jgi:hypothetical protein